MRLSQDYSQTKRSKRPEGINERGRACRVLVVDDEEIVRKMVVQVLRSVGYEIVGEAPNGKQAADLYKTAKPDIVTLDVMMPVMDGFTTLKTILEIDPEATVVMLTSESDKELVVRILKEGAKGYIVKPVQREAILQRLRQVRGLE